MKNWKDIYELPLEDSYIDEESGFRSERAIDSKRNFVFQFINVSNDAQVRVLDAINGKKKLTNKTLVLSYKDGYIFNGEGRKVILMRGWGNLTGSGAHNLKSEDAANIQDTFAEYIVSKLNER